MRVLITLLVENDHKGRAGFSKGRCGMGSGISREHGSETDHLVLLLVLLKTLRMRRESRPGTPLSTTRFEHGQQYLSISCSPRFSQANINSDH
jgi:hypothetical protein